MHIIHKIFIKTTLLKAFTIFVIISIPLHSSAIIFEKGDMSISLKANFKAVKQTDNLSLDNRLNLSSSFGYFFNNKFMLKAGVGYSYFNIKNSSSTKGNIFPFHSGIRYWKPLDFFDNKIYIYGETVFKVSYMNYQNVSPLNEVVDGYQLNYDINISPGIFLFLSEKTGLDLTLGGFNYYVYTINATVNNEKFSETSNHFFELNFNPTYWKIGFSYFIR